MQKTFEYINKNIIMGLTLKDFYLDTFIAEYPSMLTYNYTAIKDYIHTFYDPSGGNVGYIKVPVNTTGSVRATTGIFGNLNAGSAVISKSGSNSGDLTIQGNLVIIGTTTINNVVKSDLDYVTAYNGAAFIPRDASYAWESVDWKYIDVSLSYYKIKNDASIALNITTLGQIVSFIFDTSLGELTTPFELRLDPSNNVLRIDAIDASVTILSLISTYIDASSSNAIWRIYDYGAKVNNI